MLRTYKEIAQDKAKESGLACLKFHIERKEAEKHAAIVQLEALNEVLEAINKSKGETK